MCSTKLSGSGSLSVSESFRSLAIEESFFMVKQWGETSQVATRRAAGPFRYLYLRTGVSYGAPNIPSSIIRPNVPAARTLGQTRTLHRAVTRAQGNEAG